LLRCKSCGKTHSPLKDFFELGTYQTKSAELEKKKFLEKYFKTAELLGVSLTNEHLLPAIVELVRFYLSHGNSSNKITRKSVVKGLLSPFLTS
jgi:hypothetical protein